MMCGMVGAVGPSNGDVSAFLRRGLEQIQYRGYDSHGYVVQTGNGPVLRREVGPASLSGLGWERGSSGIAHTRWASHGEVCERNAHPHAGAAGEEVYVAANGIVDNHLELRAELEPVMRFGHGSSFLSETDTESLAHYASCVAQHANSLDDLMGVGRQVSDRVHGRYSALIFIPRFSAILVIIKGLPVYKSKNQPYLASDPMAFTGFVGAGEPVLALPDGVAVLSADPAGHHFVCEGAAPPREFAFTPEVVKSSLGPGWLMAQEKEEWVHRIHPAQDFDFDLLCPYWNGSAFVGSGSSYHAALFGQWLFNRLDTKSKTHLACRAADYQDPLTDNVYFLTQSGETADVLEAIKRTEVSRRNLICNRANSSAHALLGGGLDVPVGAGPEQAVAATKSFALTCLRLLELAHARFGGGVSFTDIYEATLATREISTLELEVSLLWARNVFVAGNGMYYPFALEFALKLKECACIVAEGMSLAEFRHGPLAVLDPSVLPVVIVGSREDLANLNEVDARSANTWVITEPKFAGEIYCNKIVLPTVRDACSSVFALTYLLQTISYNLAMRKRLDPDMPRNICKSVTV